MHDRPRWLDALRPDDLTAARLRRAILDAAQPLLAARRDSWWDVASEWATPLTPIAAALTLLFAGLAIQQVIPSDEPDVSRSVSADVVESLRLEAVPAGFSAELTNDARFVFAALEEANAPDFRVHQASDTTASAPSSER